MTTILTTPSQIEGFQMLARKGALHSEIRGLKRRGQSAYSICKQVYGLKGNKQKVYEQMVAMCNDLLGETS